MYRSNLPAAVLDHSSKVVSNQNTWKKERSFNHTKQCKSLLGHNWQLPSDPKVGLVRVSRVLSIHKTRTVIMGVIDFADDIFEILKLFSLINCWTKMCAAVWFVVPKFPVIQLYWFHGIALRVYLSCIGVVCRFNSKVWC